jgi:hypothetical protein
MTTNPLPTVEEWDKMADPDGSYRAKRQAGAKLQAGITAQVNNAFSNRDMCAFCGMPGVCSGALIVDAEGFGYICTRCAVRHALELVAEILDRLSHSIDSQDPVLATAVGKQLGRPA